MRYMCLFQPWFPRDICLGVGLLSHMVVLFLVFKGISIPSSVVAVSVYTPTNSARAFPFLHTLSSIYCFYTFWWWAFWLMWGDISLWFWFAFLERQRRQWHPTPVLLPGKSHGRRSLVGCSPWGREELDTTEWLHFHFSLSSIGEGNGNQIQCSCLENPRDRGAWWAAICGVAQSRTQLKRLSSSSSSNNEWCWASFHVFVSHLYVFFGEMSV